MDGSAELSRRSFLLNSGALTGAALAAPAIAGASQQAAAEAGLAMDVEFQAEPEVRIEINGTEHRLAVEPRVTLLDLLRERLGLTGTKKGCNFGECGACTVHVDGRRVNACMTLAAIADGKRVTTIEGLLENGELHAVQQAFIDHDAFQCGYCTPGQIMSAVACIREGHAGSPEDIREWMSGNICRCSAYPQIVAAVQAAARRMA
jgi:xanthine dehydrogenase YagT iron-sulfur-binding subunit